MRALTRSRDAQAGLAAAVLGVIYLVAALQIEPDRSTASVLGPRFAPLLIGAAVVACAVALVVQGARSSEVTTPAEQPREAGDYADEDGREVTAPVEDSRPRSRWQVVVTFAVFAAYVVAFIPLGYLLSTFAFLVAMTTYVDRNRLVRNVIYAAVFAPVVFVLFNYGLQVQLPPGLLG